jgi:hypothetical protein
VLWREFLMVEDSKEAHVQRQDWVIGSAGFR